MPTLLLKFRAPLQAWGAQSRFKSRQTNPEPTKSGVVGLLAAALGRSREDFVDDLAQLEFAVRVDYEGQILHDYQTARNWFGKNKNSQISHRYYLQDAVFLVALGGEEAFLSKLELALRQPVFPLYLGRRSCPANHDLVLGIRSGDPEEVLRAESTWYAPSWIQKTSDALVALPLLRDAKPGESADTLQDIPVSFNPEHRKYALRSVFRAEPVEMSNAHSKKAEDDEFMMEVLGE